MFVAPWSSNRARLVWSVIPAVLTLAWVFGNLASAATSFPDRYTFGETCEQVWNAELGHMVRYANIDLLPWQLPDWVCWVWPVALIACWVFLVTANSQRWRVLWSLGLLVCAGWIALRFPLVVLMPIAMVEAVFGDVTGESYMGGIMQLGSITPWLVLASVCLYLAVTEKLPQEVCVSCGYSHSGLREKVCPECGTGATKLTPERMS